MMQVTLSQVADLVGGTLEGPAGRLVNNLKGIEEAGPEDVAFLANPKYAKALPECKAGVVLVSLDQETPPGLAVIRLENPYLGYAKLLTAAFAKPHRALGVMPGAAVDPTASLGEGVSVYPLAYVGPGAVLGQRVVIHPGAVVGEGASVGDDTVLHPNVVLYHGCKVGRRCIIHGGTVIGADGYGFAPDGDRFYKIPQVGIVEIEDDVEIGSNCTVDRAALGRTWIKSGVKVDNLVHVAHNCVIGENTLLVAQCGVSGSSQLGRNVVLGGQVGVVGHIKLGDRSMVAAQAGVSHDLAEGEVVGGSPAFSHRAWLKTVTLFKKLPQLFDRVKALEKKAGI